MNYFFSQLTRSIGVFFRTVRAFFTRKLMGLTSLLRRMTNFSRHATKVASSSLQGVMSAAQKPTSPSDYVETGHLFISKALIIRLILGLVAVGLIVYFLVWPFVLSRFMTAKFYEKDKRVKDWSGRVIVYSDEKKTIPLYAGRLEKGVLQGECTQYDSDGILLFEGQFKDGERTGSGREYENGVLVYEGQLTAGICSGRGTRYADGQPVYDGQYMDGLRSGSGTAYENGQLLYEGQFLDDLYEGRGKLYENGALRYDGSFHAGLKDGTGTLYENNMKLYEGQFVADLYDGRGKLYQDGVLSYDGSFRAGLPEGDGTTYYPSGRPSYQGQFLAGKPDGTGTEYDEDGKKTYVGSYTDGLRSGAGTVFFGDGGQLVGEFQDGEAVGNVTWNRNGLLYFEGGWSEDGPSGFGSLYAKSGKKLYEGPFLDGTVDGAGLLDDSTEALRAAFCEGNIKNESGNTGFRIIAEELGVSALCTFQTENRESQIREINVTAPEKGDWVSLLPGGGSVPWPEGAEPVDGETDYTAKPGVAVASGTYFTRRAETESLRVTALYADESRDTPVLLTWERLDVASGGGAPGGGGGKDSDVEKLLKAMDKMISSEGTTSSVGASFGGVPTDKAFVETTSVAEAVGLADAMIDFWEETERMCALEEISERYDTLISDAENAMARGIGSAESVEALRQAQLEVKAQIDTTKTAIKRAELQASNSGVTWMTGYALEEMLVSFDPSQQDVSGLVLFASAYEKATGGETDGAAIEAAVKDGLLNLSDAHSAAKLALARYQSAAEETEKALDAYSMGLASKESWYDAMNAEARARTELCFSLADFSKQANHFNHLTGGWVSRTFHWHQDVFEPMFRAEIQAVEESAETPAEKPTEEPAEEPAEDAAA